MFLPYDYVDEKPFNDPKNAAFLVHLSKLAYDLPKVDLQINERQTYKFDYGSIRGLVVDYAKENLCVVVFAGSATYADWISNLDFRLVDTPIGNIHHGFYKSYLKIPWQYFLMLLEKFAGYLFIFAGHSRGGAFAAIAAAHLALNQIRIEGVCTFGQPKVGGSKWARFITKHDIKIVRYVHRRDIVPSLPPGTWERFSSLLFFVLISLPFFFVSKLWKMAKSSAQKILLFRIVAVSRGRSSSVRE